MTETLNVPPGPPAGRRRSTTKVTVLAASGALVLAAGVGVAGFAVADPTPSPSAPSSGSVMSTPSSGSTAGPRGHGDHAGRGGPRGAQQGELATQLAAKLGVDEAKVTTALKEIRAADRPDPKTKPTTDPTTQPTTDPKADAATRQAALAKVLAGKLGIDEAKVTTALQEIQTEAQAERTAAFTAKLDAAVKASTITQAEADAVLKAAEAGVIGMGGGPR